MVISKTPLRISFGGGGTDFADFYRLEGGVVTSTTIDKYVYVIVKERFDNLIVLNYSQKEIVETVEEIEHDLIREAMKIVGISKGVEITTLADIPSQGTGLGSSSSITVGLLNALYNYVGISMPLNELARLACKIEIDELGKPIGKQDQYAAALGGLRLINFFPDERVEATKLNVASTQLHKFNSNLLLYYTDINRSADNILIEQKANTFSNIKVLRILKRFAVEIKECLENENFDYIGEILHQSWEIKKKLAKTITNGKIDLMYEKARKAGAIGGKITGAGGGGFLLLYVPLNKHDEVRKVLHEYRELHFSFDSYGSRIIFNSR